MCFEMLMYENIMQKSITDKMWATLVHVPLMGAPVGSQMHIYKIILVKTKYASI